MELTKDQLRQLLPKNPYIDYWHNALSQLLPDYEINTPQRIAAFIAQCAHESGNFVFLTENLNYKAESLTKIFGKYFKDMATAKAYEKKPEKIANKIYADIMGNGNEASGDGWRCGWPWGRRRSWRGPRRGCRCGSGYAATARSRSSTDSRRATPRSPWGRGS